jgi:hypothetical protein
VNAAARVFFQPPLPKEFPMAEIGDLVPKSGLYTDPGVIIEKKEDGGLVIDTEPMTINKYHRFTNTTGLSLAEKERFNTILDQIYAKEDDVAKINDIQDRQTKNRSDEQECRAVFAQPASTFDSFVAELAALLYS